MLGFHALSLGLRDLFSGSPNLGGCHPRKVVIRRRGDDPSLGKIPQALIIVEEVIGEQMICKIVEE